jgi:CheY-like chemotaxis protein
MNTEPFDILLVEDNPADAELLCELIADVRGERFRLRHVSTLGAALPAVGEAQFDAVLLALLRGSATARA